METNVSRFRDSSLTIARRTAWFLRTKVYVSCTVWTMRKQDIRSAPRLP